MTILKSIRSLNPGWIVIMLGLVTAISGLAMKEGKAGEKTFLCFDEGCIYIQGMSSLVIGGLCLGVGVYLILKK